MAVAGNHRLPIDDFARTGEAEIFTEDDRVEFIDGEIRNTGPIGRTLRFAAGRRPPIDSVAMKFRTSSSSRRNQVADVRAHSRFPAGAFVAFGSSAPYRHT